jgi:hypothetical protein
VLRLADAAAGELTDPAAYVAAVLPQPAAPGAGMGGGR